MKIFLGYHKAFDKKALSPEFDELLYAAVSEKGQIEVTIQAGAVKFEVQASSSRSVRIEGSWRINLPMNLDELKGIETIALPFVMSIRKFIFPIDSLCTLGREDRSPADWVYRNLFASFVRGDVIQALSFPPLSDAAVASRLKEMQKRYQWLLKGYIKDDLLDSASCQEHFVLQTCLDTGTFKSEVLKAAAAGLRNRMCNRFRASENNDYDRFLRVRQRVLAGLV